MTPRPARCARCMRPLLRAARFCSSCGAIVAPKPVQPARGNPNAVLAFVLGLIATLFISDLAFGAGAVGLGIWSLRRNPNYHGLAIAAICLGVAGLGLVLGQSAADRTGRPSSKPATSSQPCDPAGGGFRKPGTTGQHPPSLYAVPCR